MAPLSASGRNAGRTAQAGCRTGAAGRAAASYARPPARWWQPAARPARAVRRAPTVEGRTMSGPESKPRVLVLLGTAYFPPFIDQIVELHRAGLAPRAWLLDLPGDLTLLDQRSLTNPPRWRRSLYRIMPIWVAQVLEAFRVRRQYDVIFAWGAEQVAMPFALLLKLTRTRLPFVTLFSWVSPAKKAWFLRDRKSTRLNSSHEWISYAVFCLKKKRRRDRTARTAQTILVGWDDVG